MSDISEASGRVIDSPTSILSRASSQTSLSSVSSSDENNYINESKRSFSAPSHNVSSIGATPLQSICFVGAGYVGGPTAAVMAFCNPDIKVTVVDMNQDRIEQWKSPHLPIHEPGLHNLVRIARDGTKGSIISSGEHNESLRKREPNLFFSTDCDAHIASADMVFLSVNTPTKTSGCGAGSARDMSMFLSAAESVARVLKPGAIIVEKSTVPCRTASTIRDILSKRRPGVPFEVLSNPEFLAEGTAIADLLRPSRVLIGSGNTVAASRAVAQLVQAYSWVPPTSILTVDVYSSELSKLVANAMLAQRISSINAVSAICEKVGASVGNVARAIGEDPRIGRRFLKAGLGYGGSCFKKDVLALCYLAESLGLPEVARYWQQVDNLNEWQRERFIDSVTQKLASSTGLEGCKIAVLGFAFKKDTGDVRHSQAVSAIRQLVQACEGTTAEIAVFDPLCDSSTMKAELFKELPGSLESLITTHGSPYTACTGASAILILTEWEQFSYPPVAEGANKKVALAKSLASLNEGQLVPEPLCAVADCAHCRDSTTRQEPRCIAEASMDWERVAGLVSGESRCRVFDGRGMVDPTELSKLGFDVAAIGL